MFSRQKSRHKNPTTTKRTERRGIVTVEFALCLPLLALICFGSIQVSSTILLRHRAVATLEIATLDYVLGKLSEEDVADHLTGLAKDYSMVDTTAEVTEEMIDGAGYLRVQLHVPISENITSPIFIGGPRVLTTSLLVYRPN